MNTGNIARQTISFNGLSQPFVQTYKYDSLYRLKEANEEAGSTENWKQNFTYDRYGNRQTHDKEINGNLVAENSQTHPTIDTNTNRFDSGQGYSYDKVGNLIVDAEGRTFTFDGNNKQTFITDGNNATVGEYFYDGSGMRVKKNVYSNGQHTKTVIFVYSGGKLAEEYSTEPVQSPKTKYLTEDHLGTPRIITDGNGEVVSRRDFLPFGEDLYNGVGARNSALKYSTTEDDVRQKFTGYQKDEETGLDFAEARMYENRHARFTAVDPLIASGNSASPQTFNRYVYVTNNPIAYTDPTGLVRDWVSANGETFYDSDITSQEEAEEKYGTDAVHRPNGSTIEASDGQSYSLFGGGLYEIGVGSGQFEMQNDRASGGGSGAFLAFAMPNPTFGFFSRGQMRQSMRSRAQGRYSINIRYNINYHARYKNIKPFYPRRGQRAMFNPNNPLAGRNPRNESMGPAAGANALRRRINPSGEGFNCCNTAVALDAYLNGRPTSALPRGSQNSYQQNWNRYPIPSLYNKSWIRVKQTNPTQARQEIINGLLNSGPGTTAIIYGRRANGLQPGHVFNAVNNNGNVTFLHGQFGRAPNWNSQFSDFRYVITNKP